MKMLDMGDKAPDFTLEDGEGKKLSLKDLRGKKVVLYFYPKDDTPGCTKQACAFRDLQKDFAKKNAVVFGISRDDADSHESFTKKFKLNFPLLIDADKKVHTLFGAWGEKSSYGQKTVGVLRTTVVIDENGIIQSIKRGVKAEGNAEKTLELLS